MTRATNKSLRIISVIICLIAISIVLAWSQSAVGNIDTHKAMREVIARSLPNSYSESFEHIGGNINGNRFGIVCAEPYPAPVPTNTPPYIKLFLLDENKTQYSILWSSQLATDNVCVKLAIHNLDKSSRVISVVSRPYSGSITRYKLHLYRYKSGVSSLTKIRTISYVDGVATALPAAKFSPPAFLIYEPVYGARPKYKSQPYKFYLYTPTKDANYKMKLSIATQNRYNTVSLAYKEIRPKLYRYVHSRYNLPELLHTPNQEEQDGTD